MPAIVVVIIIIAGRTSIVVCGIVAGSPNGEFAIDFFKNDSLQIIHRFHPRFGTKTVVRTAQRSDLKYERKLIQFKLVCSLLLIFFLLSLICISCLVCRFYEADEEKYGVFPFKRGKRFVIGITITREAFNFYVNGQFFTYFNHRESIDQLAIIKLMEINGAELIITHFEYHNDCSVNVMRCLPAPEQKPISPASISTLQTILE